VPYIKKADKQKFYLIERELILGIKEDITTGELNYLFTLVMREYLRAKGKRYSTVNDIRGAIENAFSEFYRRIVGPYEDQKIEENGDVYIYES